MSLGDETLLDLMTFENLNGIIKKLLSSSDKLIRGYGLTFLLNLLNFNNDWKKTNDLMLNCDLLELLSKVAFEDSENNSTKAIAILFTCFSLENFEISSLLHE